MKYPEFLSTNATIGIVAPSFGCHESYMAIFDNAVKKFTNLGYHIKYSRHIYGNSVEGASAPAKIRAIEFTNLYLDDDVDFIFALCGGEIMMEILPYLDFKRLAMAKPKYFMGSSDNTNLTFILTTMINMATIFGVNFNDFGFKQWDLALQQAYEIITGKTNDLYNYDYLVKDIDEVHCEKDIQIKEETPQSLSGKIEKFEGRLIGGTLDCLANLIGTSFDNVDNFINAYRNDGFIWYLESCDLDIISQYRALWQLKQAGWFKNCNGILYGRAKNSEEMFGLDTAKILDKAFSDLEIPVIYNCDIGHVKPCWTIINGAYGIVDYQDDKLKISYIRS